MPPGKNEQAEEKPQCRTLNLALRNGHSHDTEHAVLHG